MADSKEDQDGRQQGGSRWQTARRIKMVDSKEDQDGRQQGGST